jgi:hypothetical protein
MQVCNYCDVEKLLCEFQKRKNGNYHKQCTLCGKQKAEIAREYKASLRKQKQQCIDCEKIKTLLKFYKVGEHFHNKCLECCDGIDYVCGGCNTVKDYDNFYIRNDTNKPRGECKTCVYERKAEWKIENEVRDKQTSKKYRDRPDIKEKNKIYQADLYKTPGHKEHKAALARISSKKRYKNDPNYRMKKIMRARFSEMVSKDYKKCSVLKLVGCDDDHLFKWLEYQFDDNMNWDNQGDYWHIDHIKPCALFDFSNIDDQKECFHWTNLQPLFKTDNLMKSDTYNDSIKNNAKKTLQYYIYVNCDDFLTDEQKIEYDINYSNIIDDLND